MKLFIRNTIYSLLSILNLLFPKKLDVVILCYHSFSEEKWRFSITLQMFEKQLQYLSQNYIFISPHELKEYLNGNKQFTKPAILITIDDGYQDVLNVRTIFKKYSITPLLFLLSDPEKGNKEELDNNLKMLSTNEIKELISDGWVIGSHTATHTDLTKIAEHQLDDEIAGSKNRLEKSLNLKIEDFSYPRGRYNNMVLDKVKNARYIYGYTMDDAIITSETSKLQIPRVGVDQTHSMNEFMIITSYWAIQFRKCIKTYFPSLAL